MIVVYVLIIQYLTSKLSRRYIKKKPYSFKEIVLFIHVARLYALQI